MKVLKVICIESFSNFKNGELYEVIDVARIDFNTLFYRIDNSWYNSLCFKTLKKVRSEKLKRLGII